MKEKKILYTATVVKTHIRQFHIPYLTMLKEMGWRTEVAAKNDYENPEDCIIPSCDAYYNVPFERVPWKPQNLKAYRMLKKLIRENEYDVIHCHTPVGAMITRLAAIGARKKGTKVVYTAHGFHFYQGAPLVNWLLYYPAEWLLAPLTDVLVTINREDYVFAQKHLKAKKIVYIPGVGVDREKFCPDPEARERKRRELGFSQEDFVLLTVAEMTKNKNHSTVLKALSLMKDREEFQHLTYLIAGRGDQWKKLEKEAKELGISDHVRFLGYRTDAADLYRASDVFVFVSFREGLPVAMMEAMSSGLPVVCTRIRGNADLVEDCVDGLFTENNPQALSRSLIRMCRDPKLRKHIGDCAADKAACFNGPDIRQKMRELYEELVL